MAENIKLVGNNHGVEILIIPPPQHLSNRGGLRHVLVRCRPNVGGDGTAQHR